MLNIEKIQQSDAVQLKEFLQETFDPNEENFGCLSCIDYETHHYPKQCKENNCYWLKIGGDLMKWLYSEVEN